MALRKNSKAPSWVGKKIKQLRREGYEQSQAIAVALSEARRHGLTKNPEEDEEVKEQLGLAEEISQGWHGRDVRDVFEVQERHEYKSELAFLGELIELEITNMNVPKLVVLTFSKEPDKMVSLGCSTDRKQLFLVGGDQEMTEELLEKVAPSSSDKDHVCIGNCYSISYFADKHHLTGPKQQKNGTDYIHEFGEQSYKRGSVEQKLAGGALPLVIYDRMNKILSFVGGIYEVRDEGIWD